MSRNLGFPLLSVHPSASDDFSCLDPISPTQNCVSPALAAEGCAKNTTLTGLLDGEAVQRPHIHVFSRLLSIGQNIC